MHCEPSRSPVKERRRTAAPGVKEGLKPGNLAGPARTRRRQQAVRESAQQRATAPQSSAALSGDPGSQEERGVPSPSSESRGVGMRWSGGGREDPQERLPGGARGVCVKRGVCRGAAAAAWRVRQERAGGAGRCGRARMRSRRGRRGCRCLWDFLERQDLLLRRGGYSLGLCHLLPSWLPTTTQRPHFHPRQERRRRPQAGACLCRVSPQAQTGRGWEGVPS